MCSTDQHLPETAASIATVRSHIVEYSSDEIYEKNVINRNHPSLGLTVDTPNE